MQRVYEFHSLTAEAAQCGGNSDSTGPLHGAPVPPTLIHDTKGCEHLQRALLNQPMYDRCAGECAYAAERSSMGGSCEEIKSNK